MRISNLLGDLVDHVKDALLRRKEEAAETTKRVEATWHDADVKLTSSRF